MTDLNDLTGRRVVLTAQRRAEEFAAALERRGIEVIHAPTMSHVAGVDDEALMASTRDLIATAPDDVVVTTGIGLVEWLRASVAHGLEDELRAALTPARFLARGAKAHGAIKGAGFTPTWTAHSETVDEITAHLLAAGVAGRRVAVQHHGAGQGGIDDALRNAGADVASLVVYRWGPPPDAAAVDAAVRAVAAAEVDAVAFTAAPGVEAFFAVSARLGLTDEVITALADGSVVAAAVGDTTGAPLRARGIEPVVPDRFRLGALVRSLVTALEGRA